MFSAIFSPQELHVAISAIGGIAAHWAYFIHGELDVKAANIARLQLAVFALLTYLKFSYEDLSIWEALLRSAVVAGGYVVGLSIIIIIFWLSPRLSPLGHVPGPFSYRFSKLPHMWHMGLRRKCEILEDLHGQYGDVVRTGPNEVTVFGLDAYNQVHESDSKCIRAAYYDILHPLVSLDTTRDEQIHTYRRKLWDQAFSIKSLEGAESIVYSRAAELVNQLQAREGQVLNISAWLEYYTFDFMGLFGLTIDFKKLTEGEHPILKIHHIAHHLMGPLAAVPWLKHLLMGIAFVERVKYYRHFFSWAGKELERNIQNNKSERQNVIGYVLSDAKRNGGVKANWNFVLGDFCLVIIAGSDPVRQGGMTINGTYIPEYTTIMTPQYSLMRDPRYLVRPTEWIPERFTTRPEVVLNKSAFVPWAIGKKSCLGKNLSLMEIRIGAALLLTGFDFRFVAGEDGTRMFTQATDFFTTTPGPLEVVLKT
ncbi:CypX cytochrome P450 [Podospora fimiseda]|uniref:CypX cytochrome P450 n=1 Tax=Podospora fimiseda TaxID=252190 RepID=A0AAN7BNX0_9PEZI|nr:CypX cytochrome P450 [Podospora fimiseda]